jgi:histidinol-phosphate aminotransferase
MRRYLRPDLLDLSPYKAGNETYRIKMDANESPYDLPLRVREILADELLEGNSLNLYPDSDANKLREQIAEYLGLNMENILIGTGSDELIHIIIEAFVGKGERVLCPTPSFGMYKIFTRIAAGTPVEYALDGSFDTSADAILEAARKCSPKIIFICTPNNPTGNVLPSDDIIQILENFDGVVAVDEAYGEFADETMANQVKEFGNLVVLKTFSKAMGLAGLRIGYSAACKSLTDEIYMVKPPYNINSFSQRAAMLVLDEIDLMRERIRQIVAAREWLYNELKSLDGITVFPSRANFLLIKVPNGRLIYERLLKRGILVRHYIGHPVLENCLRITLGLDEDNKEFLQALKEAMVDIRRNGEELVK